MPCLRKYNIFISHAWRHCSHYEGLVGHLEEAKLFWMADYSVPPWKPVVDPESPITKGHLKKELTEQIRPSSVVLIIAGMWVSYKEWIQYEIDEALRMKKPIIGVKPWGQERIPDAVSSSANEIVGWNAKSIIEAIRRHA